MRETGLVGAGPADAHSAVFTAGYRGAVGQCHGGVTAVPPDHDGVRGGSILKAAG